MAGEVAAGEEGVLVLQFLEQASAGGAALVGVHVEGEAPVRFGDLDLAVHHIAEHDQPARVGMLVTLYPEPAEQGKAIGAFSFIGAAGASLGLVLGGVLTELANWHWIFLVNLPIGLLTLALATRVLDADPPPPESAARPTSSEPPWSPPV